MTTLSRNQLGLISSLLHGEEISQNDRQRLIGVIDSMLWQAGGISERDRKLIQQAEREGRVQKVGVFVSGLPENQPAPVSNATPDQLKPAWRDGRAPDGKPEKKSRMKPQAVVAKDGEELLAALGL